MKTTKILISFILCITMLFCITACTDNKKNTGVQENTGSVSENETNQVTDSFDSSGESSAHVTEPDASAESFTEETKPSTPTEPDSTKPGNNPTENEPASSESHSETSAPEEGEPPTESSTPGSTAPSADAAAYLAYYEMSAAEQQAFIESFGSLDAFFAWHTAAKAAYEAERTPIDGSPIIP